jgi:hypothetical protein
MLNGDISEFDPPKLMGIALKLGASMEVAQELFDLAVSSRNADVSGYQQAQQPGVPSWFSPFIPIEAEATSLDIFESSYITGLLQTRAYMEAVAAAHPFLTAEEEKASLNVKLKRYEAAFGASRNGPPPAMRVVHDEACLLRLEGTALYDEQIDHLLDMSDRFDIGVYVLPRRAGIHPAMEGSFSIMGFSHPAEFQIAYAGTQMSAQYEQDRQVIARLCKLFSVTLTKCVELREHLNADQRVAEIQPQRRPEPMR